MDRLEFVDVTSSFNSLFLKLEPSILFEYKFFFSILVVHLLSQTNKPVADGAHAQA